MNKSKELNVKIIFCKELPIETPVENRHLILKELGIDLIYGKGENPISVSYPRHYLIMNPDYLYSFIQGIKR